MKRHLSLVPPPPNTASINIRLSKEAKEKNLSKAEMLVEARALCAREGIEARYVHIDEGSGAIRNRKGFIGWLDDAREGRVDTLVAFHVDRMTREGLPVAGMIMDVIYGTDTVTGQAVRPLVRLIDCKGLDSAGDREAFEWEFVVKAQVARSERRRMSERSKDMHRRLKARGRWAGGPMPFGFRVNEETGKLVPELEEAAFLRQCAERAWVPGAKLHGVLRWANSADGRPPRRAKAWTRTTLFKALTHTPTATEVDMFTADERASLRHILNPEGTNPEWRRNNRAGKHVASGLLLCEGCKHVMYVGPRRSKPGSPLIDDYKCSSPPGACPHRSSLNAKFIDQYLEEEYLRRFGDQPEWTRAATPTGFAAMEAAQQAMDEALAEFKTNPTPEAVEAYQAAHTAFQEADAPQTVDVTLTPSGRTMGEAWERAEMPERQALLKDVFGHIVVGPGNRGMRKLDLARLHFDHEPVSVPFTLGQDDPATYRPGQPVVVADDEDEAVARARAADEAAARDSA